MSTRKTEVFKMSTKCLLWKDIAEYAHRIPSKN